MLTGRTLATVKLGGSTRLTKQTTIEREALGNFEVDPSDPAHATGRGSHWVAIRSGGQRIEARSKVFVQATPEHFHISINLTVHLNGSLHASKHWTESIERQLL